MSLQSKFFAYFLIIALTPLIIVGFFSVVEIEKQITRSTVDHLSSVANLQEARINEIIAGYLQEVKLVTSKTQLRLSLAEYSDTRNEDALAKILSILADTKDSISNVQSVSVVDLNGTIVASTDAVRMGRKYDQAVFFEQGLKRHMLARVFKDEDNLSRAELVGPLFVDNNALGMVSILINIDTLVAVTEDYSGLGETGEVIVAKRNSAGDALFLTPLRFDAGASLTRAVARERADIPIISAVNGDEGVYVGKATLDYREVPVIAVTRFLDAVDWGVVAKIDQSEAFAEISKYRSTFLFIVLFVLFVVVALSFFISNSLATPLSVLAFKAQALENGDFSLPIDITKRDEIGRLGVAFNTMSSKLQESYATLENKVLERTKDLEHARAKDEAMLSSIGDGLVVVDTDMKTILINQAAQLATGYTNSEALGKIWPELVLLTTEDGKKIPASTQPLYIALKKGQVETATYQYTRKDNTTFPVAITASPVNVSGELIGAVVVFRDVTKEREVDKAKTEFVSLASHQLRTPLSAVNWYAEMLLAGDAGKLNEEQKKYLDEIYIGNQRMVDLVNALLNVSRLELGTFVVEPEKLNVIELAKSVMTEIQPLVEKRSITLTESHADNLPEILADPKLVRMVFQNLLSNAVKYTPEKGAVDLQVGLAKKGDTFGSTKVKKESITISVIDTGLGIPETDQSKVFTKLFRADNVRETDAEGTGLGLYIVKSIVEQAGGSIWFESPTSGIKVKSNAGNGGTAFYVLLPVVGMKKKEGTKSLA